MGTLFPDIDKIYRLTVDLFPEYDILRTDFTYWISLKILPAPMTHHTDQHIVDLQSNHVLTYYTLPVTGYLQIT